jgi:hypothetical protein
MPMMTNCGFKKNPIAAARNINDFFIIEVYHNSEDEE